MILVSSCLLGIKAKYNGGENTVPDLVDLCRTGLILPVCPEQLGGSPTPRPPAEIRGGTGLDVLHGRARVYNDRGEDITDVFIEGAHNVLKLCRIFPVQAAILKERSPSCGCNLIYDGTFRGARLKGRGVTAALLEAEGIPVYSEEELCDDLLHTLFKT